MDQRTSFLREGKETKSDANTDRFTQLLKATYIYRQTSKTHVVTDTYMREARHERSEARYKRRGTRKKRDMREVELTFSVRWCVRVLSVSSAQIEFPVYACTGYIRSACSAGARSTPCCLRIPLAVYKYAKQCETVREGRGYTREERVREKRG